MRGALITPKETKLRAANGTDIHTLGEGYLQAKIDGRTIRIRGIVTEHVAEIILGIDWLLEMEAMWDFKNRQLKIVGVTHILLESDASLANCRRIVAQDDIFVSARSQMDILGNVIYR